MDQPTPAAGAQQPAPEQQRARYGAAIRPNMLLGLQDAELDGPGGTQRINEWADWIADTLATVRDEEMDRLRAELNLSRAGASERSDLLEEARDALSAAGALGAHADDWPRLVPAIEQLAARAGQARGVEPVTAPTPCGPAPQECDGAEPCDRHEIEQAHADGEHQLCDQICEIKLPSDEMRNFILAKSYPGAAGMLDELLRRAGQARGTTGQDAVPAVGEQETRQQIAAAIHRYDNHHGLSGNDMPSDHHRGEADAVLPVVRAAVAAGVRRALEDAADDAVRFKGAWPIVAAWLRDRAAAVSPAREHAYRDAVNAPLADSTIEAINERLEAGDAPRRKVPAREQRHCGQTKWHPPHTFMRMEALFQCGGTEEAQPPAHLAAGANAEDCPACAGTNPPYPFLCPGEPSA